MSRFSVPYGSPQLPVKHDGGFALPWVKQLVTQSAELNAEHGVVLQKLNALLRTLSSGDPTSISLACSAMSAEARAHFANEEELMLATDYPVSALHIEQHDKLMRHLARIRYKVTSDIGFWSPASELSMLEQWFVPHLTYADQRFANFIAARRARRQSASSARIMERGEDQRINRRRSIGRSIGSVSIGINRVSIDRRSIEINRDQ